MALKCTRRVHVAAHAAAKLIWPTGVGVVVLFGLLGGRAALARELIWVTVDATAPVVSGDTKKARQQAVLAAERQAVAEALAKGISLETLLVNLRLSGSIVGAIPHGKVVEKKILEERLVKAADGDAGDLKQLFRVRIKAGVAREADSAEPSFHLQAAINRSVFKEGDELQIQVRSTKDCYFAIFNILEDQKVIRLLPNYLSQKNFLSTNENYEFPGSKDRKKGLKLIAHLPDKKTTTTESIYILALTRPFELKSIKVQEGIFGVFNGKTVFMKDLIREVVGIPLKNRAEVLMQYEIRKTKMGK
ncbi:MAG: DUF4384 domain-containing protein [Desulfobacteraceae bacterium]|jgi:hypothetical protein